MKLNRRRRTIQSYRPLLPPHCTGNTESLIGVRVERFLGHKSWTQLIARGLVLPKNPGESRGFVQIRLAHRTPLQSDGLWLTAPAVQRLAAGAKAGRMGKSGEAVE